MSDLIRALREISKYLYDIDEENPIICDHKVMCVHGVNVNSISDEALEELKELGFFVPDGYSDVLYSYRFGSADSEEE